MSHTAVVLVVVVVLADRAPPKNCEARIAVALTLISTLVLSVLRTHHFIPTSDGQFVSFVAFLHFADLQTSALHSFSGKHQKIGLEMPFRFRVGVRVSIRVSVRGWG